MKPDSCILGIESSCDETSAAVLKNGVILSNIIMSQEVHARYGGVVPELASRAHLANIVPVVSKALSKASAGIKDISAVAYTSGPGLLGALLVGSSFAKTFALSLNLPLVEVHHMRAHIEALFIPGQNMPAPEFPFLCLTVSGGHTQIVLVESHIDIKLLGETRDDAAGEAFDKIGKLIGLPYPAGPEIDKLAHIGRPGAFTFPIPQVSGFDFSFSGLKTSVMNFLARERSADPGFPGDLLNDLCASVQHTIIRILMEKFELAARQTGIKRLALSGGVSANSGLRTALKEFCKINGMSAHYPDASYCTDNAAMIAMAGYHALMAGRSSHHSNPASARRSL